MTDGLSGVSRETGGVAPSTPSVPEAARRVFPSERLDIAARYADLLATDGVARGLIGPRETPRLWERHLINCALVAELVPHGASVADIGSGAGLPGLVLAIARPDLRVTLVEPLLRRTSFLAEAVAALGLSDVEVVRARAEELHGRRTFGIVTSRAVAPLERLLRWSMPLVAPEGAMVAMKGSSAQEEIAGAGGVLRQLRCAPPEVRMLGAGLTESTALAIRVAWAEPGRVSSRFAVPPTGGRRGADRKGRRGGKSDRRRGA